MGNSNTGLKSQFGVGDPKNPTQNTPNTPDAGSDKQAQDFQAAFKQEQGGINEHLQYTAVNAEAARHDPLAARRDALFTAFQAALGKIDRKDPSKAQGAIDKVLADARALSGEAATFRQQAEKAKNDWDSRQGKYDEGVHQVEELEAWGDAKAAPLRGLVDGIRKQVNLRQYAQATTTLDQLLPKLVPIYEEYLRQKEAKPKYEEQMAAQSTRLEPLKAADRPSQPMTAKAGEADAALQEAKGKADTKDFVAGLEATTKATALVDALDALTQDPQRQQYLADSSAAGETCEPQPEPAFKSLDADWVAISTASAQAQPLADSGDYGGANQALTDSKTKRTEFQTKHDALVQQKQTYDDTLAQLQPRLQAVATLDAPYASLQPLQRELTAAQTQMESAATAEDFGQASTQAQELTTKVDAIEQAKAEIDQKKQAYETALAAVQPRLEASSVCEPQYVKLEPMQQEITTEQGEMEAAAQAGDYDKANQCVQDVSTKLDTFEQAKVEIDQQKQAYETALAALQPRLQAASVSDARYVTLEPMQQEFTTLQTEMEAAAQAGDYDKANQCVQDLGAKLDAFEQAKTEVDQQKKDAYQAAWAPVQTKLKDALLSSRAFAALNADRNALTSGQSAVEAAAASSDFENATKLIPDLNTKVDAYLVQVKTKEDEIKKKGDDITKQLDGASDATRSDVAKAAAAGLNEEQVKGLPTDVRNRLLSEMQKGGLSDGEKSACKNLFSQKYLDPKFEKLDDANREKLIDKMQQDPDFKKARTDWATMSEADRVKVLKKAADYQAEVYGIGKTEVEGYSPKNPDGTLRRQRMGEYDHANGKLMISREAMQDKGFDTVMDTVVHENGHRYQNMLVDKLNKTPPEIKPGDPEYDQAMTFKLNNAYYVQPKINSTDAPTPDRGDEYFTQPMESHSRRTGEGVAAAGIGK